MRCPICQREFSPKESSALPFCGERCRTIDLGRWLGERYPLPTDPEMDEPSPVTPSETANVEGGDQAGY